MPRVRSPVLEGTRQRVRAWLLPGLTWAAALSTAAAADTTLKLLVFGDSLSAHYAMAPEQGWVGLLQKKLRARGLHYEVANASVSGENTAGGLARVEKALAAHLPAVFVLTLGINDGFRQSPVSEMKRNLAAMVRAAQSRGATPLIAGLRLPAAMQWTAEYRRDFDQAFAEVAAESRVAIVPFLLEGIADRREYYQSDGVHPNVQAQPVILENVWRHLEPLLRP